MLNKYSNFYMNLGLCANIPFSLGNMHEQCFPKFEINHVIYNAKSSQIMWENNILNIKDQLIYSSHPNSRSKNEKTKNSTNHRKHKDIDLANNHTQPYVRNSTRVSSWKDLLTISTKSSYSKPDSTREPDSLEQIFLEQNFHLNQFIY